MPDITMCQDKECHKRKDCYRYMAVPGLHQSVFMDSPRKSKYACDYFMPIGEGDILKAKEDSKRKE